jgi:hypothetical protein
VPLPIGEATSGGQAGWNIPLPHAYRRGAYTSRPIRTLHSLAVERLPGGLSYGEPRLPRVGRPLLYLVAGEHHQLEGLGVSVRCPLGVVLAPHGLHAEPAVWRMTSAAMWCAEWVTEEPSFLGSSERMTTGASRSSSGR